MGEQDKRRRGTGKLIPTSIQPDRIVLRVRQSSAGTRRDVADGVRAGFTLIEVLLAALLISIVIGALFAAFFIPARAIREGKAALVAVEESVLFLYRFTEEVTAAYHHLPDFPFLGTGEELEFFSAAGTDFSLAKVHYRFQRRTGEEVVVYRVLAGEEEAPVLRAEELAPAYYDGEEWHDLWEGDGLPRAVSLKLRRKGRDYTVFAAPRADFSDDAPGDNDNGDNDG